MGSVPASPRLIWRLSPFIIWECRFWRLPFDFYIESDEVEMNTEAEKEAAMKPTIYIPSPLASLLLSPLETQPSLSPCAQWPHPSGKVLAAAA